MEQTALCKYVGVKTHQVQNWEHLGYTDSAIECVQVQCAHLICLHLVRVLLTLLLLIHITDNMHV